MPMLQRYPCRALPLYGRRVQPMYKTTMTSDHYDIRTRQWKLEYKGTCAVTSEPGSTPTFTGISNGRQRTSALEKTGRLALQPRRLAWIPWTSS